MMVWDHHSQTRVEVSLQTTICVLRSLVTELTHYKVWAIAESPDSHYTIEAGTNARIREAETNES